MLHPNSGPHHQPRRRYSSSSPSSSSSSSPSRHSPVQRARTPSRIDSIFNSTYPNGTLKASSRRNRLGAFLFILLSILLLRSKLTYFTNNVTQSPSSVGEHRLPGFASRKQFLASRRTDALLRAAQRQRTATTLFGGRPSGTQNFSDAPPFTFCPTAGPDDELNGVYGRAAILKTRTHVGSTERVRKVIQRGMAGLPITVGILGGSVSSCQGLDPTPLHPYGSPIGPNCYPHRIFEWLNDVFPNPANELTNGACEFFYPSRWRVVTNDRQRKKTDLTSSEIDSTTDWDFLLWLLLRFASPRSCGSGDC